MIWERLEEDLCAFSIASILLCFSIKIKLYWQPRNKYVNMKLDLKQQQIWEMLFGWHLKKSKFWLKIIIFTNLQFIRILKSWYLYIWGWVEWYQSTSLLSAPYYLKLIKLQHSMQQCSGSIKLTMLCWIMETEMLQLHIRKQICWKDM